MIWRRVYRHSLRGRYPDERRRWEEDRYPNRTLSILDAIAAPETITDKATRKSELWIRHPFPTFAEPERLVQHVTGPDWRHPSHWDGGYPTDDLVDPLDPETIGTVTLPPPSGYKLRQRHRIDDWSSRG